MAISKMNTPVPHNTSDGTISGRLSGCIRVPTPKNMRAAEAGNPGTIKKKANRYRNTDF
jgi:hypothetical protein